MIVGSVSLTAIDLLHSLGKCFVVRGEDEIPIQVELECRWSWRGLVMRQNIFFSLSHAESRRRSDGDYQPEEGSFS